MILIFVSLVMLLWPLYLTIDDWTWVLRINGCIASVANVFVLFLMCVLLFLTIVSFVLGFMSIVVVLVFWSLVTVVVLVLMRVISFNHGFDRRCYCTSGTQLSQCPLLCIAKAIWLQLLLLQLHQMTSSDHWPALTLLSIGANTEIS